MQLAFNSAKRLKSQSLAFDILRKGKKYIVSEVSYAYPSWSQHLCPGHWEVSDENTLAWKEGQMWPEEAQVEDFLVRLKKRKSERSKVCI